MPEGFLSAIISFVIGLILLIVMIPIMHTTLTAVAQPPIMNMSQSDAVAAMNLFSIIPGLMPIIIGFALFIGVFKGVIGSGAFDGSSTSRNTAANDIERQLSLAESTRRAHASIQQENARQASMSTQTPGQTRRQELMELDAATLAPSTAKVTPEPKVEEKKPEPVPQKSRWEALE